MRGHWTGMIVQGTQQAIGSTAARAGRLFESNEWAKYALEIAVMVVTAMIVRLIAQAILRERARHLQNKQKHLVELGARLLTPGLVIAVVAGAFNLFPLSDRLLRNLNRVIYVAILALGIYCLAKVSMILLDQWLDKDDSRKSLREPTEFAVHVIFAAFGTMILLENLGISLTSVWTTLGVGSVAVALALQDTLSNFFAGIYLRLDRPVSLGDYIKLQSGEEGYVEERSWRSTRIKALSGHMIIIPNSRLATTILTNFSLPDTRLPISIAVSVSITADAQRVEDLLLQEASAAAGKIPGLPVDASPSVQFTPGFSQNSLEFALNCTVATYVDQYSVQNELRKRIFHRLRAEKIEFPVLQREVHVLMNPQGQENRENGPVAATTSPKEMTRGNA